MITVSFTSQRTKTTDFCFCCLFFAQDRWQFWIMCVFSSLICCCCSCRLCVYEFLLMGNVFLRLFTIDGLRYQPALNEVKRDSSSWALVLSLASMYLLSFFFFIYAFIFRGKAEGAKSLLDLSIIVCRTSPGTSSPKPHSLVFHSKRQVKANVSCNAILEEGSYMMGMLLIPRKVNSGTPALRWCYMGRFATMIYSATQRHSIAMLQQCCNHETMSQQGCNAVLR